MNTVQTVKQTTRILGDRRIKVLPQGRLTQLLNQESRLMNGANQLSSEQYSTVTAPYVRGPSGGP